MFIHCSPVARPQPLSTITKRSASEKVMSRAGFINNVLTKIEEVWLGATPQSSPSRRWAENTKIAFQEIIFWFIWLFSNLFQFVFASPRAADVQSPKPSSVVLPDPFLGTPITMTSKRKSRYCHKSPMSARVDTMPLLDSLIKKLHICTTEYC